MNHIVGTPPPVLADILNGRSRVTGRWVNEPYEAKVNAMQEHVIAATFGGAGQAIATLDGKTTVNPIVHGGITFLPRGHDGHFRLTERVVVSNVYLGPDRLQACADDMAEGRQFELLDRVQHPDPNLFSIMRLICDEADSPQAHSRVFLERALDILCIQLLRGHSTLTSSLRNRQAGLATWQVRRVTTYMRDHLSENIGLQELADVVGFSRFHFCSAFRKATGTSPYAYLTHLRMETACKMLQSSNLPVGEIGGAVGYGTTSAFSSAFTRNVGISPREFRRNV